MEGKDTAILLVLLAAFATAGWVIYLAAGATKRHSPGCPVARLPSHLGIDGVCMAR